MFYFVENVAFYHQDSQANGVCDVDQMSFDDKAHTITQSYKPSQVDDEVWWNLQCF